MIVVVPLFSRTQEANQRGNIFGLKSVQEVQSVVLALQYAAKMAQADGAPSFAVERRDDDGRGSFSSMRG